MVIANGPSNPKPTTAMEDIGRCLQAMVTNMTAHSDRLTSLANRTFGPVPEAAAGSSGTAPSPSGAVGSITELLHDLSALIERQQSAIERLDNIA